MDLHHLLRLFRQRPIYQRLFFAFTLGLFLSCAMHVAEEETERPSAQGPASGAPSVGGTHG